jgi:hypothetical protein
MVSLPMVMQDELRGGSVQGWFSEEDQLVQTGFFDTLTLLQL